MKKENSLFVYILVSLALFIGVLALFKPVTVQYTDNGQPVVSVGGQSGQEQFSRQYFHSGFQYGCERYATSSTAATFTLTAKEITGDRCFLDWTPNVNTTLTLMATSTMTWLGKNAGDTREFLMRNASSTAAATFTLAEGTGSDFQKNEDTADLAINGLDTVILKFVRKADSDVMIFIDEYTEG
jgi:hypothetical protein